MGRVKEETIKGLFVRVFNRLYTERIKLLGDYKAELEREKFDHGRIAKLDEEIESLIQQERALFFIEENLLKAEHNELAGRLTKLQAEREELTGILSKQDSRIARTLELGAIIEAQGGRITEFSEDLYIRLFQGKRRS